MNDQVKIPCMFIRGGTSRGPYFLKSDLPSDINKRDKILLAAMGSPDLRQIDGLGGAEPVKSKVAIIDKSSEEGIDIDYYFAQVKIDIPCFSGAQLLYFSFSYFSRNSRYSSSKPSELNWIFQRRDGMSNTQIGVLFFNFCQLLM